MSTKEQKQLIFVAQHATETRMCKHIYLRGNHRLDMFHDKVDKINVWNRLWLSAAATDTEILSIAILDNHLHMTVLLKDEKQDSDFMHYFRLSITQYYNRRYEVHGVLGTRDFGRGILKDLEDLKDCICYHIRNISHHRISSNYLDYEFSTARYVYGLQNIILSNCYTFKTIPQNIARAYLPVRVKLPEGWFMSPKGMIVPPPEVFRGDIIEALYCNSEEYLETLKQSTYREAADLDEPCTHASQSRNVQTLDERVSLFVRENSRVPIPSMSEWQKMEAIIIVKDEFPKVSYRTLERLFGIPATTIRWRYLNLHIRD